jgi:uncharacterized protein involved in exopolysaccharide biosynthesis
MIPATIATYWNDGIIVGFAVVGSPTVAIWVVTTLWAPGLYGTPQLSSQLIIGLILSLVSGSVAVVLGSGSRRLYSWHVASG